MSGAAFGQIIGIPLGIVLAARWGFRSPFYIFAVTMAATVFMLFYRAASTIPSGIPMIWPNAAPLMIHPVAHPRRSYGK